MAALRQRALGRTLRWLLLALGGLGLAIAFHAGFALPLQGGVVILALAAVWGILGVRVSRLSLLPRFMLLAYCLPFSTLLGYLLTPNFVWHYTERGRNVLSDPMVVRQLITVGLVGLLGLLAGMRWAALRPPRGQAPPENAPPPPAGRTLAAPVFYGLLPIALAFSWISAPPETIFQAVYATGQSEAVSAKINFPAAYMLSYILLVILAIDAERERSAARRAVKLLALAAVAGYIVIVLQVLRGDRESAGLVVALVAIYITSPAGVKAGARLREVARRRIRRLALPLFAVVALFIALGALRARLSQASVVRQVVSPVEAVQLGLSQTTWTAVLWTNLSLAWEYRQGDLHYKYGQTYLDYLLSLPPGVITHALGYERPMEAWKGIGWEDAARIAVGGLHPVVAPFRNFGAFGVFFILALFGFLIGRVEQHGESGTLWGRVLWASVFCAGFNWFWYGDMPFIRALMFAGLLFLAYRVALSLQWHAPRALAPAGPDAGQAAQPI